MVSNTDTSSQDKFPTSLCRGGTRGGGGFAIKDNRKSVRSILVWNFFSNKAFAKSIGRENVPSRGSRTVPKSFEVAEMKTLTGAPG
jgi:hypothetical protein